jgi:hypothetical protein
MRLLLHETSTPEESDQDIIPIYQKAAEWGVRLWSETLVSEIRSLDQVHNFCFPSETLDLHHFHSELKGDLRMDGQPVLVAMQPPLYMRQ